VDREDIRDVEVNGMPREGISVFLGLRDLVTSPGRREPSPLEICELKWLCTTT